MSYIRLVKQQEAIRKIRALAKAKGVTIRLDTMGGKGSHVKIYCDMRQSIIPYKMAVNTYRSILKQLDLKE